MIAIGDSGDGELTGMDWKEIKTAPRFWKALLVWGTDCGTQIGHYDEGWGCWVKAPREVIHPTHWMYLPVPPGECD
jgi:hypothetical protein